MMFCNYSRLQRGSECTEQALMGMRLDAAASSRRSSALTLMPRQSYTCFLVSPCHVRVPLQAMRMTEPGSDDAALQHA